MSLRRLIGRVLWWFVGPVYRGRASTFGPLSDGDTIYYAVEDGDASEVGIGRFVTGGGE